MSTGFFIFLLTLLHDPSSLRVLILIRILFMLYLIIASLIWAFSFGLIKGNLVDLDASFVSWARLLVALPVFLPFLRFKSLNVRLAVHLLILGAFQYGLLYVSYTQSFKYLDGYQVALFTILTPIYVTIVDNIYKREIDWLNLAMAVLAVVGAVVIKYQEGLAFEDLLLGFALVQVANFCFAFGQIEYRRLRRKHTEIKDKEVYALMFLGAVILTSIFTTYQGGWGSFQLLSFTHIWTILFLGTVATGLGFFLWNVGAINTHAGALAVMNNIKIPLAVFVSLVFFGEQADIFRLCIGGG